MGFRQITDIAVEALHRDQRPSTAGQGIGHMAGEGTLSLAEACPAVVADVNAALGTLASQVGVLNDAIEDLQTGSVTKVDIAKFQAAGQQAIAVCSDELR